MDASVGSPETSCRGREHSSNYFWENFTAMLVHLIPHIGLGGDVVAVKAMIRAMEGSDEAVLVNGLPPADAFNGTTPNPLPLNEGAAGFRKAWSQRAIIPRDTRALHAHSPVCLAFALALRRLHCHGAKVVMTMHSPVPDAGLRRWAKGKLLRAADAIHVVSVESRETLRNRYRVPDERLRLIYPGIPVERFTIADRAKVRGAFRARLGIPDNARIIGYLGRLATEKNVGYLLRFMEEQRATAPSTHLVIAGTGGLEQELRAQAISGAAADRIHFTGYTREPESVYPAFDLLVLPSDFEGCAFVVVEAAYCGVPTLRSDAGGSRDQIQEGVTGFKYPQEHAYDGMRRALSDVLNQNWERLPTIGQAARAHCLQLYDMRRFAEGIESMYRTAKR